AQQVADKLTAGGVRVEIDNRSERLNAKIRDAQVEQVPLMLIIGDQEVDKQTVSLRRREDDKKQESMSVDEVIKLVTEAVK
ncbi:threonine--tRNA ligase, partial [bacterium]|nr:threonine--tRNA ligase [bacterium]